MGPVRANRLTSESGSLRREAAGQTNETSRPQACCGTPLCSLPLPGRFAVQRQTGYLLVLSKWYFVCILRGGIERDWLIQISWKPPPPKGHGPSMLLPTAITRRILLVLTDFSASIGLPCLDIPLDCAQRANAASPAPSLGTCCPRGGRERRSTSTAARDDLPFLPGLEGGGGVGEKHAGFSLHGAMPL